MMYAMKLEKEGMQKRNKKVRKTHRWSRIEKCILKTKIMINGQKHACPTSLGTGNKDELLKTYAKLQSLYWCRFYD